MKYFSMLLVLVFSLAIGATEAQQRPSETISDMSEQLLERGLPHVVQFTYAHQPVGVSVEERDCADISGVRCGRYYRAASPEALTRLLERLNRGRQVEVPGSFTCNESCCWFYNERDETAPEPEQVPSVQALCFSPVTVGLESSPVPKLSHIIIGPA